MLQTVDDLKRFTCRATDDELGKVKDVHFDDRDWTVRYLLADTPRWLPGRTVLLAPAWWERIQWADQTAWIELTRERIAESPSPIRIK